MCPDKATDPGPTRVRPLAGMGRFPGSIAKALASIALAAGLSCSPFSSSDSGPRNLVLVTVDTLRADHLGCYGYFRDTSPNLDRLARQSIVFDACFAPVSRTTPSHLSLMTSVYPLEHGIADNFVNRSTVKEMRAMAFRGSDRLSTIASHLSELGYRTSGFVSATPVKRITGLSAGFQEWNQNKGVRRSAPETTREVLAWLDEAKSPFLLWIHYFDPHGPYGPEHPPPPYNKMYGDDEALQRYLETRRFPGTVEPHQGRRLKPRDLVNLYDGAVRMFDDSFGRLLDTLEARNDWNRTVLVVASDHGQGLGQHDAATHGDVWDEQLRLALLLRAPGETPRRVDRTLSIIDIVPTALRFLPQLEPEEFWRQARGQDVLDPSFVETPVFGMSPLDPGRRTLISGRWKVITDDEGRVRLFDLAADPFELEDRHEAHPELVQRLSKELETLMEDQRRRGEFFLPAADGDTVTALPDEQTLEEMRALGYVD
jgi:arylsulfatase